MARSVAGKGWEVEMRRVVTGIVVGMLMLAGCAIAASADEDGWATESADSLARMCESSNSHDSAYCTGVMQATYTCLTVNGIGIRRPVDGVTARMLRRSFLRYVDEVGPLGGANRLKPAIQVLHNAWLRDGFLSLPEAR